jgi:hypothetical protein
MVRNLIKNKKGWIRLIEVFISIVLLIGVLLVVASKTNSINKNDLNNEIYKSEIAILRDIELNNTLRNEILSVTPPLEWDYFGDAGLQDVKSRIIYLSPLIFECKAKICLIDDKACILDGLSGENVYAESVIISGNLTLYSPRQLKLFCMEN